MKKSIRSKKGRKGGSGFPIRAGNRAGSDPITSPIKALKKLPALLPVLGKKITSPTKVSGLVGVVIGLVE